MSRIIDRIGLVPLLVIGFGILLRFFHLASMPSNPRTYHPGADEDFYIRFGMDVAQGTFGMTPEYLFMDPFYGYLLGLIFGLLGQNLFIVFVIQSLFDAATIGLTYLIGKELAGRRAGLIAAICYGLASTAIFNSTTILKPTLTAFYLALWVYFGLRLWHSGARWVWFAYGLFLGVGVAIGSSLLLLALLGLIAVPLGNYLEVHRDKLDLARNGLLVACGLSLVLTLIAVRVATISGHWSFLPPNGGVVLHQVYNPENPRGEHAVPSFVTALLPSEILFSYQREAERRLGKSLSPYAMSSYWREQALEYVCEHPIQSLENILRKIVEFASYKEIANNRALNEGEYFSKVLALLPRPFGWLLVLGVPGLVLITLRTPKGWLLLAALGAILATFAIFFAVSRFRFPIVPILAVGTGVTLDTLFRWSAQGRRTLIGLLAGIALLGALSLWSSAKMNEQSVDSFIISWGWGYLKMGDLPSAQALSEGLLKHEPDNYRAYELAGYLALMKNEPERAGGFYGRALAIEPRSHNLWFNYAVALEGVDRSTEALEAVENAIRLNGAPEYLYRKALLLRGLGRWDEARTLLQTLASDDAAHKGVDWRKYAELARARLGKDEGGK